MSSGGFYGKVEYSIHRDPVVRSLHPDTRGTYVGLCTAPENTALPGLILAGRDILAASLGLELAVFDERMDTLRKAGLVLFDWGLWVCYIPALARMQCNAACSIWAAKHWRRVIASAPKCDIVQQAAADALALLKSRIRDGKIDGKAILASFVHGDAISSVRADIILSTNQIPAQQSIPFRWEQSSPGGERPSLHALDNEVPELMTYKPREAAPEPGSSQPTTRQAGADGETEKPPGPADDDAVAAFQEVVSAAGGHAAVGMARIYASDATGLPGNAAISWCQLWGRLRKERPDTTLQSARLLGEYGRSGGWDGLRCPWQALVKSVAHLAAMLDEAEDWHQRGRPALRKGPPQPEVSRQDDIIGQAMRESRRTG